MESSGKKRQVFVVSDATGQTCERVVKAALAQFERDDVDLHIWSYVRTVESVEKVLRTANEAEGIIFYTLVGQEERNHMEKMAANLGVVVVDLLGPVLIKLAAYLGVEPKKIPGLYQELISDDPDFG
jgi:regulator of PEP synthase PpsR (kinase-PPPase family)